MDIQFKASRFNVLIVLPNLSPGGMQSQAIFWASGLMTKGAEVKIVATNTCNNEYLNYLLEQGYNVVFNRNIGDAIKEFNRSSIFRKIISFLRIRSFLRENVIDVLIPFSRKHDLIFGACASFTPIKSILSLEREGDYSKNNHKWSLLRFIKQRKNNVLFIANSKVGVEILSQRERILKSRIHQIPNIVSDVEKSEFPFFTKAENGFWVIMVANFFPIKDHLTILNAWANLNRSEGDKLFVVGGEAPGKGKYYKMTCEEFINERNLNNSIHFLGSIKNSQSYLHHFDLGVLSSKSEGSPNVLLEYMHSGLPVVASDIPSVRDLVPVNIQERSLFPVGDFKKASSLILSYMNNPDMAKQDGRINKEMITDIHSKEKVSDQLFQLIKSELII